MTYEDTVVVDAVAHAYNTREDNAKTRDARELQEGMFSRHQNVYSREGYAMSEDQFFRRTTAEELEIVTFEESCVDFAIYHTVQLDGFFEEGLIPLAQGIEFRERNPDRTALYGFIDPFHDEMEAAMEYQVNELGVDGIKLYPSSYKDGDHLRMSLTDGETGRAVLELAEAYGVTNVGIHKMVPLGNAPMSHFRVEDLDEAAGEFRDIRFELVHAGFSFLEESVIAMSRHPNVYANLESTSGILHAQPRQFAKIIGEMVKWAGPEKILFATGTVVHPQSLIESFMEFEIPEDMKAEYGYPTLTPEMKAKIMGLNALQLHDIDVDDVQRNDQQTRPGPWSSY